MDGKAFGGLKSKNQSSEPEAARMVDKLGGSHHQRRYLGQYVKEPMGKTELPH